MRTHRLPLALLVLLALGSGCSGSGIDDAGAGGAGAPTGSSVRIRLRNDTGRNLERILVRFPSQDESYGDLVEGEASVYRAVQSAYRYAFIEAWHGDELYRLQPLDYVGESMLQPGDYTYVLSLELLPEPSRQPEDTLRGLLQVEVVRDS